MIASATSRRLAAKTRTASMAATAARCSSTWSGSLSFASPEADFSAVSVGDSKERFFSSQATMTTTKLEDHSYNVLPQEHQAEWSDTLSFASPESDFSSAAAPDTHRYPESFAAALLSPHACVVTRTTSPHHIVAVNAAWEKLCGYKAEEVIGKSLSMLQGKDTNTKLADSTVERANGSSWVDMYVRNYKKNGDAFTNHVSLKEVGLSQDEPNVRFLLGVLAPVDRAPLRMI